MRPVSIFFAMALLVMAALMAGCAQVIVDSKGIEQQVSLDVFSVKSGKASTVLIAHGCDGVQRNLSYREWARQISGWGYNAIVVDSYSKRGIAIPVTTQAQKSSGRALMT